MSDENVAMFRKATDAFNRQDLEAYLETVHPEVEWYPPLTEVEGGVMRGHEGVRRWWSEVQAVWDEIQLSFEDIRDLGDAVLGLGRMHGRSKSGVPIDVDVAVLYRVRDGVGIWGRGFSSHVEALEAAGLSEDDARSSSQ